MAFQTNQVRFFIPRLSPSLNEYRGMNPHARKRLKLTFGQEILFAVNRLHHATRPPWLRNATGKRTLTIYRISYGELDKDNLYGGLKPVVDAIKEQRLIKDDRPSLLDYTAKQVKILRKENYLPGLSITISLPLGGAERRD